MRRNATMHNYSGAPVVEADAAMVDGAGLPRERTPRYTLISAYLNESELFLRYRRDG